MLLLPTVVLNMDLSQQISQGITGSPCSIHVCFKHFSFNAHCQSKLLLTLHHHIFGVTPFGWLHTRMLLTVYETHGTEQRCGQCAHSNCLSHCAITIQFRVLFCVVFICLYLSLFLLLMSEKDKTASFQCNLNRNSG